MEEPLTTERIREMFRDFGLEHEDERRRFLSQSTTASVGIEEERQAVFVWAESTSGTLGEDNAKLAQHS